MRSSRKCAAIWESHSAKCVGVLKRALLIAVACVYALVRGMSVIDLVEMTAAIGGHPDKLGARRVEIPTLWEKLSRDLTSD